MQSGVTSYELTAEERAALRGAALLGAQFPGNTSRPEVGLQSMFEASERAQVGPRRSVENRGDGCVVDSGEAGDLASGATVHDLVQFQRKRSGSFHAGVVRGALGPVVDGGRRDQTGGPRHAETVRPNLTVVVSEEAGHDNSQTASFDDGGSYHQTYRQVERDAVSRVIRGYNATGIQPEHWAAIETFVRRSVAQVVPNDAAQAAKFMTVLAAHVHWCWQDRGYELEPTVIFRNEVIDEFLQKGTAHMSRRSVATYRSRLVAMSKVLLPWHLRTGELTPMGRVRASEPYSHGQVAALHTWAQQQGTEYRKVNCHVLLSLGLGTGLSAGEVEQVRTRHVVVDDEGVLVQVVGERPRLVPILTEWEGIIAEVARAAMNKDQFLFKPRREAAGAKNLIPNFIAETTGRTFSITVQRLRVTWLVAHLAAGTPITALHKASGVQSPEALARYAEFVPEMDPLAFRRAMRATSANLGVAWRRGQ